MQLLLLFSVILRCKVLVIIIILLNRGLYLEIFILFLFIISNSLFSIFTYYVFICILYVHFKMNSASILKILVYLHRSVNNASEPQTGNETDRSTEESETNRNHAHVS